MTTTVEGSMTIALFLEYLELNVVSQSGHFSFLCTTTRSSSPNLPAYPGPFSVIVMDNAKIHYGDGILELADQWVIPFSS